MAHSEENSPKTVGLECCPMDSDEWLVGAGQEGRLKWVPGYFQRGPFPAKGTAAAAVGSARLGCSPWVADLPSFLEKVLIRLFWETESILAFKALVLDVKY